MMRKQFLIMMATAATFVSTTTLASDIYRYTDADGNIHYVDRPSGTATEQRVAIASKRSNPGSAPARSQAASAPAAAAADAAPAADAAEKKLTRSEKIAAKRERDEKCASYRAKMETLVTSRRLYREGENGEREYLDESQTEEARNKVQELIETNCS
ncbi:MAG: DUF4124 domain-containing protein [Gammaproteobacteria bacterium]|nr:DUF4124 domain-containing protein [Gammaproteobacteria bacterium]